MSKRARRRQHPVKVAKADPYRYQALAEQLHDRGLISDIAAFGDYRDNSFTRRTMHAERAKHQQHQN